MARTMKLRYRRAVRFMVLLRGRLSSRRETVLNLLYPGYISVQVRANRISIIPVNNKNRLIVLPLLSQKITPIPKMGIDK